MSKAKTTERVSANGSRLTPRDRALLVETAAKLRKVAASLRTASAEAAKLLEVAA